MAVGSRDPRRSGIAAAFHDWFRKRSGWPRARRFQLDTSSGPVGAVRHFRERAWQLAVSIVLAVRDRRRRPDVADASRRSSARADLDSAAADSTFRGIVHTYS